MRIAIFALCVLFCAAPVGAAEISHNEIEHLPSVAVTQRLADQIADLLYGAPWQNRTNWMHQTQEDLRLSIARMLSGRPDDNGDKLSADTIRMLLPRLLTLVRPEPQQPFDGENDGQLGVTVTLQMKARASSLRGLCATDLLELTLSPAGHHIDADTPLHVVGFDVSPFFFYLDKPLGPVAHPLPAVERATATQACVRAAEGPDVFTLFNGPTEAEALRAAWVLRSARARLSGNSLRLDCTQFYVTTEPECRIDMAKIVALPLFVLACKSGERTCTFDTIDDKNLHEIVTLTLDRGSRPRIVKLGVFSDHGIVFPEY